MHSSTMSQELYLNHIQFQPSDVTRFSATALQRSTAEERVGGWNHWVHTFWNRAWGESSRKQSRANPIWMQRPPQILQYEVENKNWHSSMCQFHADSELLMLMELMEIEAMHGREYMLRFPCEKLRYVHKKHKESDDHSTDLQRLIWSIRQFAFFTPQWGSFVSFSNLREHRNAHSSWIPIKSQKSTRLTCLFDFSLHSHFFEMDMYIYLSPNTRPLDHLVHDAGTKRRWTSVRFNIFATCRLGKVAIIHHFSAFWQVLYTGIPNHFAGYEFVSALMFRKSWKLKIFQCWKRRMQTRGH